MNARSLTAAGVAAGAILALVATSSLAQSRRAAAAPARPAASGAAGAGLNYGAAIPGFCVYSEGQILGQSRVGQAIQARMKMLATDVNAELKPEADAIQTEQKTLEASASTMDQATLRQRGEAWQTRVSTFEKRANQRNEELKQTQAKEVHDVETTYLQPVLSQLFQQNRCSVLIEREQAGIAAVNPAMDFTGQAVSGLDARIQTITFDRVHLDTQPSAQPTAAR
ncbi:MAG TPA: OmpH family outer membrane protein [Caulobacteraceae bacterium]